MPALDPLRLLLFVKGNALRSASAIQAVRHACNAQQVMAHELRVVDIAHEPALAAQYRIVATPTLVSVGRDFERRLVGNVSEQLVLDCFQAVSNDH